MADRDLVFQDFLARFGSGHAAQGRIACYCTGVKPAPAPHGALIFDWNAEGEAKPAARVTLLDETLRDGLQSPSVKNPTLADKLTGIALMNELGIEYVNVGLPSSSPRAFDEALQLCR